MAQPSGRFERMKPALVYLVAGFGVAVWWMCAQAARPEPRPASVILITLDTTRADYLPPYGGQVPLPAIERLAREGVVFDQAIAPAPLTLPSHTSLFTGRIPPAHGARVNGLTAGGTMPVFPERLRAAGYRTAAFVGSIVLDGERGLRQGFDVYDDVNHGFGGRRLRRPANEVVDAALGWLAPVLQSADASPFFLWVHLYDAHAPHQLPAQSGASVSGDSYADAIAFMDSQIGRLVQALEDRQALHRTAIVVAADHGESLGEHGERGHGIFVYESALRVPLIVRWPGVEPRRVPDLVQLIDVAPTILALEGLEAPPMDGVSLAPALSGRPAGARTAYAESVFPIRYGWSPLRTVRDTRFKLIEAPRPELYDLASDPHELRNLYDSEPPAAARLEAKLRTFGPPERQVTASPDGPAREQLASLGYVSPSRESTPAAPPAIWPDPKDMIGVYNDIVEQRMRLRR
jgi:arylsulfatase A-like enzyme